MVTIQNLSPAYLYLHKILIAEGIRHLLEWFLKSILLWFIVCRFLKEKLICYQPISLSTTYYLWLLFTKIPGVPLLNVITVKVEMHQSIDVQLVHISFVSFALYLINEGVTPALTV